MDTFKPTIRQRARLLLTMPIAALSAPIIPNYSLYGGATITGAHDAAGKEYTVCCAKDNRTGKFGLIVIADDVVVVAMPVSGRGSVWVSLFDGMAYWKGWEGSQKFGAPIPGFVPFTPLPATDARIAALEAKLVALGAPSGDGTLILPPQGDEGGQLAWAPGAGHARWWFMDSYQDGLRIFSEGVVVAQVRPDGLYAIGADGALRRV